ncbi:DUF2889 domain-containing protein [Azospirillum rugosum]|uniref:DUF2889 domain-containing protein n=1 Tax=Azospirillum rugosum TaxID=416170 RepID=A0ABS4SI65_9PROT|nr:DUF2889 domain-containing protein [Azospirillum rugosum]MBP2292260.1 hypothetical protein [Azospirillum rugosum]MDQ0526019.1 hypothetical protein [Azospirillum rugosum]
MPLSEPAAREPIHTREVTCRGFRRADGLWDIEGHLTDVKAYEFTTEQRGQILPGDPVHGMWIRLTVDDSLTVRAVEAVTEKSPYRTCGAVLPNFQRLVGLKIATGWTRAVKERLGGVQGCTHLVELLGPVATTAFQTIYPILAREQAAKAKSGETGEAMLSTKRPVLLNTCHIFDSNGEVVRKNWPDHYTGGTEKAAEAAD